MDTINSHACPQNHRCPMLRVCTTGAISQKDYGLPVIDEGKCIDCGKCVSFCPRGAAEIKTKIYA